MVANVETSEQVIGGKEKEELNRARGIGERVRKEMLCSGGLVQILYVLSVTCRSLLIIERQEVRMCMCVGNKSREPNCSDAFIYQLTTKRKKNQAALPSLVLKVTGELAASQLLYFT